MVESASASEVVHDFRCPALGPGHLVGGGRLAKIASRLVDLFGRELTNFTIVEFDEEKILLAVSYDTCVFEASERRIHSTFYSKSGSITEAGKSIR